MTNGFAKIAVASPLTSVADCTKNVQEIISIINKVAKEGAEIILFPELAVSSSSCGDLYLQPFFLQKIQDALQLIIDASRTVNTIITVGAPVKHVNNLYNCAVTIYNGCIVGITAKSHPTAEERRWFSPADTLPGNATATLCGQQVQIGSGTIFETGTCRFGVEVGSDAQAPNAPCNQMVLAGADVILNPAAT
ncbi:MAG: hypothetical protein IKM41_05500, partial [Tidjanibacter sp.]|nr:hypothetical protein [Tidjanibacter sp.]